MIANALRVEVERYAERMERENPLYIAAIQGALTPQVAARYIYNVRHLVRHTPVHLERARARALERGNDQLANHYACKLADEQGHDRWADRDLDSLCARFGVPLGEEIVPSLVGLLRYLEQTIDREPLLYLSYILFAEYLIVLRGSEWLGVLEERCGIPREMMSVIGNHAELDREHTAEGLEAIDRLVSDPTMLAPMRDTVRTAIQYFHGFSGEIVSRPDMAERTWAESSVA